MKEHHTLSLPPQRHCNLPIHLLVTPSNNYAYSLPSSGRTTSSLVKQQCPIISPPSPSNLKLVTSPHCNCFLCASGSQSGRWQAALITALQNLIGGSLDLHTKQPITTIMKKSTAIEIQSINHAVSEYPKPETVVARALRRVSSPRVLKVKLFL